MQKQSPATGSNENRHWFPHVPEVPTEMAVPPEEASQGEQSPREQPAESPTCSTQSDNPSPAVSAALLSPSHITRLREESVLQRVTSDNTDKTQRALAQLAGHNGDSVTAAGTLEPGGIRNREQPVFFKARPESPSSSSHKSRAESPASGAESPVSASSTVTRADGGQLKGRKRARSLSDGSSTPSCVPASPRASDDNLVLVACSLLPVCLMLGVTGPVSPDPDSIVKKLKHCVCSLGTDEPGPPLALLQCNVLAVGGGSAEIVDDPSRSEFPAEGMVASTKFSDATGRETLLHTGDVVTVKVSAADTGKELECYVLVTHLIVGGNGRVTQVRGSWVYGHKEVQIKAEAFFKCNKSVNPEGGASSESFPGTICVREGDVVTEKPLNVLFPDGDYEMVLPSANQSATFTFKPQNIVENNGPLTHDDHREPSVGSSADEPKRLCYVNSLSFVKPTRSDPKNVVVVRSPWDLDNVMAETARVYHANPSIFKNQVQTVWRALKGWMHHMCGKAANGGAHPTPTAKGATLTVVVNFPMVAAMFKD
jgi:hypothetical protein